MKPEQAKKLAEHPLVREVEGEGCDEGFYFVHLKAGYDFDIDPHYFRTSACFRSYMDARNALKRVIPINPKSNKRY